MKEIKVTIDKMIAQGFRLEYPYFWYLENCSIDDLKFLWELQKGIIK